MGRWRPPRRHGSPYITAPGYRTLEGELKSLWMRRREVVQALAAAAAEGDRSENAEYTYRKKELAGIDRRIRYLQKRLPVLKVVRHAQAPEQVFFGARVTLSTDRGEVVSYRIVGEDEAEPSRGDINIDSPLARSLLKKSVGDELRLGTDGQGRLAIIDAIEYEIDGSP
ncbi:MAG: GreA/GreB family elongation factor [Gammaproteobacteria bacterium]|nr:GreA/GreB family elongation factor [Gammaproteobacteria bacterium]MDH4255791.1 GreA/GreB family elongation factor [Gammaproteobacteria bacterium]MDH5309234.1 GreA/GreB family elongation factor [Gammaproteobacteria bacterium]